MLFVFFVLFLFSYHRHTGSLTPSSEGFISISGGWVFYARRVYIVTEDSIKGEKLDVPECISVSKIYCSLSNGSSVDVKLSCFPKLEEIIRGVKKHCFIYIYILMGIECNRLHYDEACSPRPPDNLCRLMPWRNSAIHAHFLTVMIVSFSTSIFLSKVFLVICWSLEM